ncbi:MAG: hypothetical protein M3P16_05360 [Chloroflexota bacterium]|nr:hypothetical protein [Chloroflexota bacterium]
MPRQAGDTTPLDPRIADALRKAGMDPQMFTLAPDDGTAAPDDIGMPPAGQRILHSFLFADLRTALDVIERSIDDDGPVRIVKEPQGWLVVFDRADDPATDHAIGHARLAAAIGPLGGADRGFGSETVVRTTTRERL